MSYEHIKRQDPEVYAAMERELGRQRDHIELIASENFVSPAVMEAMGSHLTNKYAEGYPGARYYGGCQFVDEVETLAIERAKKLFGAEHANVQPHSGSQANVAVYLALMKPGDTILGMDLMYNKKGLLMHRWYGAEIQMDIAHHVSIWGSIRDNSWSGQGIDGSKITKPAYLNNLAGVQYKEANYGGDFSDSRGGISLYAWWGSIGVQRERITWGDAQHCSNILSAHNPAVPMFTIQITPCKWFQFDYFHAWLPSNVIDSTYWYTEQQTATGTQREYRPANKFMAANMFTFMPCKYIQFGIGNSIVYAERNVQAAYFIPIAFYKSLDHLLTKGLATENQNSQAFATITVRPTDHLRLYGSFFIDEFKLSRMKKSDPQHNLYSYMVGFNWSGWPVKGLALRGEFVRSNIATYEHSIKVLDYTSNSYQMGHYMGSNAQSIWVQISYRPTRSLRLTLDYTNDTKYTAYDYIRGDIGKIISEKPFKNAIWRNDEIKFRAVYEVFNNCYAHVDAAFNYARANDPADLAKYSPVYLQGKKLTLTCGLSFGF